MKYLIVGLGNIGPEYHETRHNIGFMILDAFAKASNVFFTEKRYGAVAKCRVKNDALILLKPNTFMNLSGNAVRYWLAEEKIPVENLELGKTIKAGELSYEGLQIMNNKDNVVVAVQLTRAARGAQAAANKK